MDELRALVADIRGRIGTESNYMLLAELLDRAEKIEDSKRAAYERGYTDGMNDEARHAASLGLDR